MPKKKKPKEIQSRRRRKFLAGLLNDKSMRQSALDAGYSQSMADNAGKFIFPHVAAEFRKELERQIPIGKLVTRLAEGLDATESKFAQKDGKYTDERQVINFSERRQYAELVAKLLGIYEYTEAKEPEIKIEAKLGTGDLIGAIRLVYGLAHASQSDERSGLAVGALPLRTEVDRGQIPPQDRG